MGGWNRDEDNLSTLFEWVPLPLVVAWGRQSVQGNKSPQWSVVASFQKPPHLERNHRPVSFVVTPEWLCPAGGMGVTSLLRASALAKSAGAQQSQSSEPCRHSLLPPATSPHRISALSNPLSCQFFSTSPPNSLESHISLLTKPNTFASSSGTEFPS